ncbi:MAG: N-acyl-D-amino acid deacylase, partial [Gammaproteobacteria bacterium]|nr:N-acyl-D-amino acid deacylase [Gammaproteobacteria bacterium]
MWNLFRSCLLLIPGLLLLSCSDTEPDQGPSYDTLISNARVIDGLGGPAVNADVYIKNGEVALIAATGQSTADAAQIIDARGRVLAPGFIDVHSHGDPLQTPEFENFLAQGVTTITLGQDGNSPEVENLGQWVSQVRNKGIGVNIAPFVGHGTLRNLAGIGQKPVPSTEELQRMLELL